MTAGTRPAARKFLAPFRRDCVRGYAFNGTDFIVKLYFSAARQLVRLLTKERMKISVIANPSITVFWNFC
jgi:hypothetical protein